MNQEKIGKFIAQRRRLKKLTQLELAEKLGVSDRSVSNWENGKCMPDVSLFKPLCEELDISVNDLLSGEEIKIERLNEKFEENIVNTINYSNRRFSKYNNIISFIIVIFGLFISISAIMIFPSESSWKSIYSLFGIIVFIIGLGLFLKRLIWYKRLVIIVFTFLISLGLLIFTDYLNVKFNNQPPMFRIYVVTVNKTILYDTLFYDVYRCNTDTLDEYYKLVGNNKYSIDTIMNYCD